MITNESIINRKKKLKKSILISFLLMVLSIIIFVICDSIDSKNAKNAKNLNDIIEGNNEKEDIYAYLDIKNTALKFASYEGETSSYYFVTDGTYIYIAYMDDTKENKINAKEDKDVTVKIKGMTKVTPKDVKEIAISSYNKMFDLTGDEALTISDFSNYFGSVYIDLTTTSTGATNVLFTTGFLLLLSSFISFIIFIVYNAIYYKNIKKLSRNEINTLNSELKSKDAFDYKYAKVILTDNYVVSYESPVTFIKYDDIYWMYKFIQRTNGIKTNQSIMLKTKDLKKHVIASMSLSTKVKTEQFDEILNTIYEKNDKMLFGYTKENINEYKKYSKDKKNR